MEEVFARDDPALTSSNSTCIHDTLHTALRTSEPFSALLDRYHRRARASSVTKARDTAPLSPLTSTHSGVNV